MSYNKTTWQSGDVITAEKLNNIEAGIEAASEPRTCAFHYDAIVPDGALDPSARPDATLNPTPESLEYGQFITLAYDCSSGSSAPSIQFFADEDHTTAVYVACTMYYDTLNRVAVSFNTPNVPELYIECAVRR